MIDLDFFLVLHMFILVWISFNIFLNTKYVSINKNKKTIKIIYFFSLFIYILFLVLAFYKITEDRFFFSFLTLILSIFYFILPTLNTEKKDILNKLLLVIVLTITIYFYELKLPGEDMLYQSEPDLNIRYFLIILHSLGILNFFKNFKK